MLRKIFVFGSLTAATLLVACGGGSSGSSSSSSGSTTTTTTNAKLTLTASPTTAIEVGDDVTMTVGLTNAASVAKTISFTLTPSSVGNGTQTSQTAFSGACATSSLSIGSKIQATVVVPANTTTANQCAYTFKKSFPSAGVITFAQSGFSNVDVSGALPSITVNPPATLKVTVASGAGVAADPWKDGTDTATVKTGEVAPYFISLYNTNATAKTVSFDLNYPAGAESIVTPTSVVATTLGGTCTGSTITQAAAGTNNTKLTITATVPATATAASPCTVVLQKTYTLAAGANSNAAATMSLTNAKQVTLASGSSLPTVTVTPQCFYSPVLKNASGE